MFGKGRKTFPDLNKILSELSEIYIAQRYLGITKLPCVIRSPLRKDDKPSFGIFSLDGDKVCYRDFATGDRGGIIDLMMAIWNLPYQETVVKLGVEAGIIHDSDIPVKPVTLKDKICINKEKSKIEVKIRKWEDRDIKYWESYGIPLDFLKYAEVYPISHKIITKGNKKFAFVADKYAYAYIERKEGNVSIKIYQPFNTSGFKWNTSTDSSVISLWTKVPQQGEILCICSSLKDALCLWANTGIPALATQGEGYKMSNTAIANLKERFKKIYILYDNDKAGLEDGKKLAEQTGFTNIILPEEYGAKDISDLYKTLMDKKQFNQIILPLFNKKQL